jgi:serine protease inhibitor
MQGNLTLPRFCMDYEKTLNEVLKAMGMGIAFEMAKADFSAMLEHDVGPLWISEVKHKSFIKVDEKGTEAAAVTSMAMLAGAPLDFFQMEVNRPFFFLIHDRETNEILFAGTVVDPTK